MDKEVDVFEYRGFKLPIYLDDPGQQFYTIWQNSELCFGSYNTGYRDDLKYIIDQYLDTVVSFGEINPKYYGAYLRLFNNNGWTDLKLTYRGRIIKVFCLLDQSVSKEELLDRDDVFKESYKLLDLLIGQKLM